MRLIETVENFETKFFFEGGGGILPRTDPMLNNITDSIKSKQKRLLFK